MLPEAWNVEHNNLHHYRTGEPGDPDLVERNLEVTPTPTPTPTLSLNPTLALTWSSATSR